MQHFDIDTGYNITRATKEFQYLYGSSGTIMIFLLSLRFSGSAAAPAEPAFTTQNYKASIRDKEQIAYTQTLNNDYN